LSNIGVDPETVASSERWERVADQSAAQWPYAAGEVDFDETDREILAHLYDAWIYRVDALVGELVDTLRSENAFEDTLLLVTADHGEIIAEDGVLGHSVSVDDQIVRVPLVATGPGIGEKRVSDPVSLTSIRPTVLEALGVESAGASLFDDAARGEAFTEVDDMDPESVDEQYADVAASFGRREAMYVDDARAEIRDTGEEFGDDAALERLREFSSDLSSWEGTDEPRDQNVPDEVESRLRELGYKG